ncbi:aminotransferase class I and II [Ammonifex degensii KC4]|uniref:Aminotransferase n=1 Tax=Ammonifex degensii (strain DSM 10501 / KC4) TaxID=429009 RepID=C9RAB5_AMMDK|nr:aminotransferase class I/II-fold pyridoxal phosphate-dependent enzyme [Ammonifex degensii]ACX51224.1 aminotransferase class I and II [Ammonifex degensii KC4]
MKSWEEYLNPQVASLPPSGIRRFFDLAAEMTGVISLGVGEPDFVTPWRIREACIYALERGYTMYTSNRGMKELRVAIARYLEDAFKLRYDPEKEILVTVGVSEALDLALRALLKPGDEVLIPDPAYVSYVPCTVLAGGVPVLLPTRMEEGFKITAEQVEKAVTSRTKVLLLAYPNNPTGAVLNRRELGEIAEVVKARDLLVISDEIYAQLTYEGEHVSIASLPGMRERTVVLQGFSKAFAMTGWRLGYAVGNETFIGAMTKIHQYTMLCAPITAQMAALEALKNGLEDMRQMVAQYAYRRRLVVNAFKEMGLPCPEPKGAFYAFPYVGGTGMSEEEFCEKLLLEEKVAVVPGTAFGPSGRGHIRCSFAASVKDLTEAFRRMKEFLRRHGVKGRPSVVVLGK